MSNILIFLKSKTIWRNVGLAFVGLFVLVQLVLFFVKIYTRHGQALAVPDFVGLTHTEAQTAAERKHLVLQVLDSVFVQGMPGGAVVAQTPSPSSKVKKKRIVYITLNAVTPEMVGVPKVTDVSLRQAQAMLETRGLRLGKAQYVPHDATNYVLGQFHKGREIKPGTKLVKGSKIDLTVGMGLSNQSTSIPNLSGLSIDKARNLLAESYLNFGAVVYDNSIATFDDSAHAIVWKQKPEYNPGHSINLGAGIDIWLTVEPTKVEAAQK
jgi:beta-lactam-binding protein with PASTA domain